MRFWGGLGSRSAIAFCAAGKAFVTTRDVEEKQKPRVARPAAATLRDVVFDSGTNYPGFGHAAPGRLV